MFASVVTLLRFELAGAFGEHEITNLLTEGNGDHKEEPEPRNLLGCFLPPVTGNWSVHKRASVPNQCLQGFCVLRSVTGVYLLRFEKWVLGNVYWDCHAGTR